MKIQQGRIDVHHHIVPPAFVDVLQRKGIDKVAGAPLPKWTPEKSIEVMDMNGIQTAITSVSAPGVDLGDGVQKAQELARRCNEYSAEIAACYPGRFGSFAVLPMPFTEASCREAIHALETLGADGVVLLGSTNGVFLGDARLEELMAELDKRHATVFVHPNLHASSETLGLDMPGFLVEFLCDTTRAALNLILSGTMEKYPKIRWILSHAGGFLPYVAWRASLANTLLEYNERAPQGVLSYLRRFYFDTALSPSAYSMATLKELIDPSHILFGSDFPFAPVPLVALECKALDESTQWSETVMHGINRGHALRLFPKYRSPDEVVAAAPIYLGETLQNRMRRTLVKPVGALIEHMRNR